MITEDLINFIWIYLPIRVKCSTYWELAFSQSALDPSIFNWTPVLKKTWSHPWWMLGVLVFCSHICPFLSADKFVLVWFWVFPRFCRSRKKEPRKNFLRPRQRRGREMFPRFHFSYWGNNLGRTQNQTRTNLSADKNRQIWEQNVFFILLAFS